MAANEQICQSNVRVTKVYQRAGLRSGKLPARYSSNVEEIPKTPVCE